MNPARQQRGDEHIITVHTPPWLRARVYNGALMDPDSWV